MSYQRWTKDYAVDLMLNLGLTERDLDCLDDIRTASEWRYMRHAGPQDLYKLSRKGLAFYSRSGGFRGWQMTDLGFNLWQGYFVPEI